MQKTDFMYAGRRFENIVNVMGRVQNFINAEIDFINAEK